MKVEPYLLSGALNGVVAQRLARTICLNCVTKYYPSENVLTDAGLTEKAGRIFHKGVGCQRCHNSGFLARIGVYEVMEVTPELRRMIHRAAPAHELREELRRRSVRTLREEGVLIALEGRSSLEEVLRVTHTDSEPQPLSDQEEEVAMAAVAGGSEGGT
jgi:type II secretory ATPase GspE/PulE/Tfp pilus assembly ATPase PilB-like protein